MTHRNLRQHEILVGQVQKKYWVNQKGTGNDGSQSRRDHPGSLANHFPEILQKGQISPPVLLPKLIFMANGEVGEDNQTGEEFSPLPKRFKPNQEGTD